MPLSAHVLKKVPLSSTNTLHKEGRSELKSIKLYNHLAKKCHKKTIYSLIYQWFFIGYWILNGLVFLYRSFYKIVRDRCLNCYRLLLILIQPLNAHYQTSSSCGKCQR